MARRPVVQVTWNPNRPDEFEVYFTDASADSRPGGREKAHALAESLGFQFVPLPDETLLWKLPGSDWVASNSGLPPGTRRALSLTKWTISAASGHRSDPQAGL